MPFRGWVIDLIGNYPTTARGNKCTLAAIGLHTNYMVTIPMKENNAEAILVAWTEHILIKFWKPEFILSDNGKELKNQLFDEVSKVLEILKAMEELRMHTTF